MATRRRAGGTSTIGHESNGHASVAEQARATLNALADQAELDQPVPVLLQGMFELAECTSALQAWFRYMDRDKKLAIDFKQFDLGIRAVHVSATRDFIMKMWQELDKDKSGFISFSDFCYNDQDEAMWNTFRRWCGMTFSGSRHMLHELKSYYATINGLDPGPDEIIREREWCEGLDGLGWTGHQESTLFHALDVEKETSIYAGNLSWVDAEVKMFRTKQAAKKKAEKAASLKAKQTQICQAALKDFKSFVKKTFGTMFRAWRKALDLDGSMTVQRAELFKAIKQMNWKGDCRALWKALDHDNSGITNLEELDPHCAQALAHFRAWAVRVSQEPKAPSSIFQILDKHSRRKLSLHQFAEECRNHGYNRNPNRLVQYLDWADKKHICVQDLVFMDVWRAPAYLVATPDAAAAQAFKRQLLAKYGDILKAWRLAMDRDNSNNCNWHEFQEAAKHVHFEGNVAGAWLALDEDLSGSISLKEIDESAHNILVGFKRWADEEFGGVKSAFRIMTSSNTNGNLNLHEFKAACRRCGFEGQSALLFKSLDQSGEGKLDAHDIYFLESWMTDEEVASIEEDSGSKKKEPEHVDNLLEYFTAPPGPGAYNIPTSFGGSDRSPFARHAGGFTFAGRPDERKARKTIGPAKYSPSMRSTAAQKPMWSFGPRRPASANPQSRRKQRPPSPGPGSYETDEPSAGGPKYSMRPRRALPLHPTAKAYDNL